MRALIEVRFKNFKRFHYFVIGGYLIISLFGLANYLMDKIFGASFFGFSSSLDETSYDYHSLSNSTKFLNSTILENLAQKNINETKLNIYYYLNEFGVEKNETFNLLSESIEKPKNKNLKQYIKKYYSNLSYNRTINNYTNITIFQKNRKSDDKADAIFMMISVQVSFLSIILIRNMYEEDDKKLDILFEFLGVSKIKDFFSWYIFYCFFCIPVTISITISLFLYTRSSSMVPVSFDITIIINFILYMTNIYYFLYFIYKLFSNKKAGFSFIIIVNIFTILSSFYFNSLDSKICLLFSIIPNLNTSFYLHLYFHFGKNISSNRSTRYKGMTYYEILIMFFVQFVLYASLIIFIRFKIKFKYCSNKRIENIPNNNLIQNENDNLLNSNQDLSIKEKQQQNNDSLKILRISKKFGNLNVLNNFNLELFKDEIFCLYGPNGSGKTTLINIILGIISPEEGGDIIFNDFALLKNKNLIYENFSFCQQVVNLFDNLTVEENLMYMYKLKGIEPDFNEIQNMLNYFNLTLKEKTVFRMLSEEEKKIVGFAISILQGKKILILDEPTNNISLNFQRRLLDLLKSNKKGRIILVTTNSLEEAEYLGSRIGIMRDGNIICSGESNYLKMKFLKQIYMKLIINQDIFTEKDEETIFNKIKELDIQVEIKKIANEILINIKNKRNLSEIINYIEELKANNIIRNYEIENYSLQNVISNLDNINNDEVMFRNDFNFNGY